MLFLLGLVKLDKGVRSIIMYRTSLSETRVDSHTIVIKQKPSELHILPNVSPTLFQDFIKILADRVENVEF